MATGSTFFPDNPTELFLLHRWTGLIQMYERAAFCSCRAESECGFLANETTPEQGSSGANVGDVSNMT